MPYRTYKDSNDEAADGTCEWLSQHEQYLQWLQPDGPRILRITADAGCGKSVLAKHLVDRILPGKRGLVAYFFFADTGHASTVEGALRSVLDQIFSKNNDLYYRYTESALSKHGRSLVQDEIALAELLYFVTSDPSMRSVCGVLDGLDECPKPQRRTLFRIMRTFAAMSNEDNGLKTLTASRPYEEVDREFDTVSNTCSIRIQGKDKEMTIAKDLAMSVHQQVASLAARKKWPPTIEAKLE